MGVQQSHLAGSQRQHTLHCSTKRGFSAIETEQERRKERGLLRPRKHSKAACAQGEVLHPVGLQQHTR